MRTSGWMMATQRSIVWLGGALWLAYLKKPDDGSILSVRTDFIGWIAGGLLLLGLAFHVWSNVTLARVGEREASMSSLVVEGPYHYTRNPIYVAGIPLLLGTYLLYPRWRWGDLLPAVILMIIFHVRVVRFEEPELRRRFGAIYNEYCRTVPRWIPRLATLA